MRTVEDQIEEQYECLDQLGSGAFGQLILVRSRNNDEEYACKIEKNHGKKVVLVEKQFNILADLMDTKRFPQVYSFKHLEEHSYMIMEKLNDNLDSLYKSKNKKFSNKTIALIANEMMITMKVLHEHGYLHRDIKPENIMTTYTSHTIKLIDFGLAEKLFAKRSVALIGNVRFCSRRAHFGYSGKKEDLESLIYVIYYFLITELPWQEATESDIRFEIERNVQEPETEKSFILGRKEEFLAYVKYPETTNNVKIAFYEELHGLAKTVLGLKSDEDIDYPDLVHRTERMMAIIGVERGDCYDWCEPNCKHYKPYQLYWNALQ